MLAQNFVTVDYAISACWLVPRTGPAESWVLMYNADFGVDGGHALGYATTEAALILNAIPTMAPLGILLLTLLVATAGFAALRP